MYLFMRGAGAWHHYLFLYNLSKLAKARKITLISCPQLKEDKAEAGWVTKCEGGEKKKTQKEHNMLSEAIRKLQLLYMASSDLIRLIISMAKL